MNANRWKSYLLLGMLANELLFYVFQAVVFVIREKSLQLWMTEGINGICYVIVIFLLMLSIFSYRKENRMEGVQKQQIFEWLVDAVYLALTVIGIRILPMVVFQYLRLVSLVAAMILSTILFLILLIVLIAQSWILCVDLQAEQAFLKKGYIVKKMWKKPLSCLSILLLFVWGIFGRQLVDVVFYGITMLTGNSFAMQMFSRICLGVLNTGVLIWFLCRQEKIREYLYQAEFPIRMTEINRRKKIFMYGMGGLSAAYLCANIVYVLNNKPALNVGTYIEELMETAENEIEFENTDEVIRIYAQIETYFSALDAYVSEDRNALWKYAEQNPSDDFYWRLYYTMVNDVELAKDLLIDLQIDTRLCHDILQYYAERETEPGEEEKEWKKDCLWICLEKGAFRESTVKFDEASLRTKRVNDMKAQYENTLAYNDMMLVLLRSYESGGMDEATVYQLLDMADANPENAAYQLTAVLGGSQYLHDNAKHYGRVVECAVRLNKLMSRQTQSMENLAEQKLYLAKLVMNCGDYETALDFLKDVRLSGNKEVENCILICYSQVKQDEEGLRYIDELWNRGQEEAFIDYFAGLFSLKMRNVDDALKNGIRLAEKVLNDTAAREENNVLLYSFVQYLCISDQYKNYIDYSYRVKDYTEEQQAILSQCPLLENYINAVNAIYNSRDYENAIVSLDNIEKLCPDMSMTWFLKGTAYFDLRDYENALESFKKCVNIDKDNITAIYSLAVLYDIKGDYKKSAQLCEQILEVMPEVNHEEDWYGVSYHTRALYERIQEYVEGEK